MIVEEFNRHDFLIEIIGPDQKRKKYMAIASGKAVKIEYQNAILFLPQCLEMYYGKKPIFSRDCKRGFGVWSLRNVRIM